jgi:hypothetical protein
MLAQVPIAEPWDEDRASRWWQTYDPLPRLSLVHPLIGR